MSFIKNIVLLYPLFRVSVISGSTVYLPLLSPLPSSSYSLSLSPSSSQQSSNIPRGNVARGNVNRKKAAQLRAQLSRGISYQDMEAGLHSLRFHARERNKDEGNGDGNMNSFPSFIQRLYNHSDDEDFNINF